MLLLVLLLAMAPALGMSIQATDNPFAAGATTRNFPAFRAKSVERGGSVYYVNCTAARNAGAAPVMRGEPGYSRKPDRDNDGVGCE